MKWKLKWKWKWNDIDTIKKNLSVLARQLDGDGLGLEIIVEAVGAVLPANARHLVAAEGLLRTDGLPTVDPHGASTHRVREGYCLVDVIGHDARGQAGPGVVGTLCSTL